MSPIERCVVQKLVTMEGIELEYDVMYSEKCVVFALGELQPNVRNKLLHAAKRSQYVKKMRLENGDSDLKLTINLRKQTARLGFTAIVHKVLERITNAIDRTVRAQRERNVREVLPSDADLPTDHTPRSRPHSDRRNTQFMKLPATALGNR